MSTEMARRGLRIHHSVDGYWGRKEASVEAKEDGEDEEEVVKMEGLRTSQNSLGDSNPRGRVGANWQELIE
ncbi:uncharacterized protein N7506_006604 [Penicillium brevicompactum]|uniref:uncharacterized protein n=1 Tax=Penicillium brevicompactum TaxID=5074 RepID=UPI002540264E|nr:uncharacterized protein N7506_006604 [Penicillium brevicompactum]KAJ5332821.1 hypothetical protein N7506_006604 [Penicillium brevicompactum]